MSSAAPAVVKATDLLENLSVVNLILDWVDVGLRGIAAQTCRAWRQALLSQRPHRSPLSVAFLYPSVLRWSRDQNFALKCAAESLDGRANVRTLFSTAALLARSSSCSVLRSRVACGIETARGVAPGFTQEAAVKVFATAVTHGYFSWGCRVLRAARALPSVSNVCSALRHGGGLSFLEECGLSLPELEARDIWHLANAACESRNLQVARSLLSRVAVTPAGASMILQGWAQGISVTYFPLARHANTVVATRDFILALLPNEAWKRELSAAPAEQRVRRCLSPEMWSSLQDCIQR